jgi:copper chaperone CopZ
MKLYIHHIPGRLRVRAESIKRNRKAATEVKELLSHIAGIASIEVNTVTGSVLLTYDTSRTTSEVIVDVLRRSGYVETEAPDRAVRPVSREGAHWAQTVTPKVGQIVLSWAAEQALAAAVGALL